MFSSFGGYLLNLFIGGFLWFVVGWESVEIVLSKGVVVFFVGLLKKLVVVF